MNATSGSRERPSEINSKMNEEIIKKTTNAITKYYESYTDDVEKQKEVTKAVNEVSRLLREFKTSGKVVIKEHNVEINCNSLSEWVTQELTAAGKSFKKEVNYGSMSSSSKSITLISLEQKKEEDKN